MAQITIGQCKVCNSKHRLIIEKLHTQGVSAQQIYNYLHSLQDDESKEIVEKEALTVSGIRRHLVKHFDSVEADLIQEADTQRKIIDARQRYSEGKAATINKVNVISSQIDITLAKIESLDHIYKPNDKTGHQLYIQYMKLVKDLIESLAKLTGELKQEGTIDVNFFGTEITKFAEMVLLAIRRVDRQLQLNGQLETLFSEQFCTLWENYLTLQTKKINGEVDIDYGNYDINTFNETDL